MELEQFRIIKGLLEDIRTLLQKQEQPQRQLLVEQNTFGSEIDNKCACGLLPHELCLRRGDIQCLRTIGTNNIL